MTPTPRFTVYFNNDRHSYTKFAFAVYDGTQRVSAWLSSRDAAERIAHSLNTRQDSVTDTYLSECGR